MRQHAYREDIVMTTTRSPVLRTAVAAAITAFALAAPTLAFAVSAAAEPVPDEFRNDESYAPLKALAERGAARGEPGAKAILEIIRTGKAPQGSGAAVGEWLGKEALAGAPEAEYAVGLAYDQHGAPPEKSFSWYLKAAQKGYAPAQAAVARAHLNGKGVPRDPAQALEWCRKAAAQDYAFGQALLGYMYTQGAGVPKDDAKAAEWYLKAAEQGDAGAQAALAGLYYQGLGVPPSFEKAEYWIRKAAEGGSKGGKAMLAQPLKTRQLIAAKGGDPKMQYRVGSGYILGKYGFEKDPAKGVPWIARSAEQGYPAALDGLGYCYERGIGGLPRDVDKALAFYRAAAAKGNPTSIARLRKLREAAAGRTR
jgi:TPR repeat protein